MMSTIVYGIPNCDTVKKARAWLDERRVDYVFHDYKKLGIDAATLLRWADAADWKLLLNRAGTSFRNLPEVDKARIDRAKAVALMLANPSMIKRPVVEGESKLLIGFKPDDWTRAFG